MPHNAFVMNVAAAAGHLPTQWAVYCRQCSNDGRPKEIVKPAPQPEQLRFIRKHNKGYR
jgi:hypothetical protein